MNEIEKLARQLCTNAGKDPDLVIMYSIVPPHLLAWSLYQEEARIKLEIEKSNASK